MQLHDDSIIILHPLYHRKEEGRYIVGNPETGEFLVLTPAEFRAVQLLHSRLALKHAKELLRDEKEQIDLDMLVHELMDKGFVHKIGNRVITPLHEPLHEMHLNVRWLGGTSSRFLMILISLFGLWTLIWRGWIPGPQIFFYQPSLSLTLIYTIVMAWLLIAVRQLFKHAASQAMNVPSRYGFANVFHLFVPKAYSGRVVEEQEHKMLGHGLLALTSFTSIALLLAVYLPYPATMFWQLTFAIGFIEIVSEALLFLDTDLSKFIASQANIYKLNQQTARTLKEDVKLLFTGNAKESHPAITIYAFFYLVSIVIGIVLLASYIIPAMLGFLSLAFSRLDVSNTYFADAVLALLFFSIDLLLYGFAVLKHHKLSHNTFFVTWSVLAITAATYVLSRVGVEWFSSAGDTVLAIILTFCLGVAIALLFHEAVRFAFPFSNKAHLLRDAFLPIVSACIPICILFTAQANLLYVYSLAIGAGMLAAVSFTHLFYSTSH